jgi:sugar lactone lactonase YvrE
MNLSASLILDAQAALGEGPVWDDKLGVLHWLDINNHKIHTYDPTTGKDSEIDLGDKPGCMVPRAKGGFVVALPKSIVALDVVSGPYSRTTLTHIEVGLPNRMNDGKCDPAGRFVVGSMSLSEADPTGNLWCIEANEIPTPGHEFKIINRLGGVTISNGMAWTADGKTLYYSDTPTGKIDAFDYDTATGAMTNRRVAFVNSWGGHFDGMNIDSDDNLYLCLWDGGRVLKVNPKNGKLLQTIDVPGAKNVSCCTFGGADYRDLYITTAGGDKKLTETPHAGGLFHIALKDVQGITPYAFAG